MPTYRVSQAAPLLGASDDSVRRWIESGRLASSLDEQGRVIIDGAELARFAVEHVGSLPDIKPIANESARNRFSGLVTRVVRDTVMAQVELQCGPFRITSLISRTAADELGLEPGVTAVAAVKATDVVVEVPKH